jgi:hypothetical protein
VFRSDINPQGIDNDPNQALGSRRRCVSNGGVIAENWLACGTVTTERRGNRLSCEWIDLRIAVMTIRTPGTMSETVTVTVE